MSGDYDYIALTEDERLAGLGSILSEKITSEETNADVISSLRNQKKIITNFAHLTENKDIYEYSIKTVYTLALKEAIDEYTSRENLPQEYVIIAKDKNGLENLIKGFLKSSCYFTLDKKVIDDLEKFIYNIYNLSKTTIVYELVSQVQIYIHDLVQKKYGLNSHQELDKNKMRNLLSASRLHLEIYNIANQDISTLIQIKEQTDEAWSKEYSNPSKPKLLKNQKFISHWKRRHLISLIAYFPSSYKAYVTRIKNIKIIKPNGEYKEEVLAVLKGLV